MILHDDLPRRDPGAAAGRNFLLKSVQNNAAGRFLFYGVQQAMRHHEELRDGWNKSVKSSAIIEEIMVGQEDSQLMVLPIPMG